MGLAGPLGLGERLLRPSASSGRCLGGWRMGLPWQSPSLDARSLALIRDNFPCFSFRFLDRDENKEFYASSLIPNQQLLNCAS